MKVTLSRRTPDFIQELTMVFSLPKKTSALIQELAIKNCCVRNWSVFFLLKYFGINFVFALAVPFYYFQDILCHSQNSNNLPQILLTLSTQTAAWVIIPTYLRTAISLNLWKRTLPPKKHLWRIFNKISNDI